MNRIRIKDIAKLANVSVGTVDRVIHGRSGVSANSRKKVEEILKQLDYQPNMYASALASNKQYLFFCLLPSHEDGEYWADVIKGVEEALKDYSDFNIDVRTLFYDPYNYHTFEEKAHLLTEAHPDGVMLAPTAPQYTKSLTDALKRTNTPYIYIDSNIPEEAGLAFFGQNSRKSGYFSARMLMLLAKESTDEIVIFRKINKGIVGSNQQERREQGFRKYMKEHYPDCRIWVLDLYATPDSPDTQMLEAFFREHPQVKNGITFNSKAYIVGEYLQARGITDFNLMGYDLLERNIDCLKKGSIFFLIAQQPMLQGFNSIKALCDHLILKKEITRENFMPIDLLTKENIDFYRSK